MAGTDLTHDTFVLERTYGHAPRKVFTAFADPARKSVWYARSGGHEVVSYEMDFGPDGREVLVGRMGPQTPVAGQIITWTQTFADIVEDRRIVFTQTVDIGQRRISCALVTVELAVAEEGCLLTLTHQAVFLPPADGPEMRQAGWQSILDALDSDLA